MSWLVEACVRHRFAVIFCVLFVAAVGVRATTEIPIDAVPDVTNVQVQVLTDAPGLGPAEIEQYVTIPVETVMNGLPRVEEIRSLSRLGLSSVTIVFEEGTDIYFARQLVSERLPAARSAIPSGYGAPEMGPVSTGLGEIYQFEVRGEPMCPPGIDGPAETAAVAGIGDDGSPGCFTQMELRSLLDWDVAIPLRAIPGVVEVNAMGGELRTYEVQVAPNQLDALDLTLGEVYEAIERNNASVGGGYIERGGTQRVIRGEGRIRTLDDLRRIRITTRNDGTPIFVRDVAVVRFAPKIRQGAVTRDGRGEVVTGTIMMRMGANAGEVAAAVRAELGRIEESLPEGVSLETIYDRRELVDRTVRTVATNLIEGGALVIVVLLLLLGNLRGGLIVASVIPLSLFATVSIMHALGESANLMSFGALDFGLVVDGAIVVVENIFFRIHLARARVMETPTEARSRESSPNVRELVVRATREVIRPVLFATAIIMIVYVPILTLRGIEGKMFRPMAIAVLAALGSALVLSMTWVPACASWLPASTADSEPALMRRISRLYEPLLDGAIARVRLVAGGALLLIAGGVALALNMGAEFVPTLDEGAVAIQAIRPPQASLTESIAATDRVERVLLEEFPDEILTVVSRTGRPEIATDPMGVEMSDIYVMLRPRSEWRRADVKSELVAAMQRTLERRVPGQNYAFSQPIELRTNELISGSRADVALRIYGRDLEELAAIGDRLVPILREVPGAADVSADRAAGAPSLRIRVDRAAASRYGIDAREVLDAVEAIAGRPVGVVMEGSQRYEVQVRLAPEARASREAIASLLIGTPGGPRVPLDEVAQVVDDEGPVVINRESGRRRLNIAINVRGAELSEFVADAQRAVRERGDLPPGYLASWGGQHENLREATGRLAIAVPGALGLIFLLLYAAFGALRPAILIFANVPMAAVGGVIALALRGMPLSISAAVGFIALSGIAVMNGVVLVSTIRRLQAEGRSLGDASREGARSRLRAVLMTALTDALGFLPMAISTGAGAEVQRPLATVVIGGLFTATALTLLVLPAVYAKLGGTPPDAREAPPRDEPRMDGLDVEPHNAT